MKYQLGFEITENVKKDALLEIISREVKKEEAIKIEAILSPIKINEELEEKLEADSLTEIISSKIAELKSNKQQRQSWRVYLKVSELDSYKRKETYWLELLYEKLGIIARPLTVHELKSEREARLVRQERLYRAIFSR